MTNQKQLVYKEDVLAMAWLGDECEVVTLSDIEELPSVDAVPVVRCKDCKYLFTGHSKYCCNRIGGLAQINEKTFCSYGEKRK